MYSSSGSSHNVTSQLKLTFFGIPLLVLLRSAALLLLQMELISLKLLFTGLTGDKATGGGTRVCGAGGSSTRRSGADILKLASAPFLEARPWYFTFLLTVANFPEASFPSEDNIDGDLVGELRRLPPPLELVSSKVLEEA